MYDSDGKPCSGVRGAQQGPTEILKVAEVGRIFFENAAVTAVLTL